MREPHNLHAEVMALLPYMYWASPAAPTADHTGAYYLSIYDRRNHHFDRPIFRLRVIEVMRPDQFGTARYVQGRLTMNVDGFDWPDWQPFPTLEAAVASLTTQHRLGVGNA